MVSLTKQTAFPVAGLSLSCAAVRTQELPQPGAQARDAELGHAGVRGSSSETPVCPISNRPGSVCLQMWQNSSAGEEGGR